MKKLLLLILLISPLLVPGATLEYQPADTLPLSKTSIVEHGSVASAISQISKTPSNQRKIMGYRVRIFFANSQDARSQASQVLAKFKEAFPEIPAEMIYNNPYYKVTVGNCASSEEAIMLWGRVKSSFDRAFVYREEITIAKLTE